MTKTVKKARKAGEPSFAVIFDQTRAERLRRQDAWNDHQDAWNDQAVAKPVPRCTETKDLFEEQQPKKEG